MNDGARRPQATRVLFAAVACVGALVLASTAVAPVAHGAFRDRLADLEAPGTSPFDLDQVSVNYGTATRTDGIAYSGRHALRLTYAGGSGYAYARGILENDGIGFAQGDDFWFGAAIRPDPGFSGKAAYADLLRIDSYALDDRSARAGGGGQFLALASYANGDLHVDVGSKDGAATALIGPLPAASLPEGQWSWVELHVRLSATPGTALTQLKIDEVPLGASEAPNVVAGHADYNRMRAGLVASGPTLSAPVTASVDRLSISSSERGPKPNFRVPVPGRLGLLGFRRLGVITGPT